MPGETQEGGGLGLSEVRLRVHTWCEDNYVRTVFRVPDLLLFILVFWGDFFQDLLDSDWASVRKVLEQADILVIKYSVTDKLAFQQVRNGYAPRLRPLLRHWGVPVILVAVGARLNGEATFLFRLRLQMWQRRLENCSPALGAVCERRRLRGSKHTGCLITEPLCSNIPASQRRFTVVEIDIWT